MTTTIRIVFLILFCTQLVVYLFLYNRANWITPPGRVHTMQNVDAYYPDVIRQSKLGAWAHTYSLTTYPTPPIYTYLFFIGAGKIARLFNIDPVVMYQITRVTGGIAVFISTFFLVKTMMPLQLQLPALFFTMAFETGPVWSTLLSTPISEWAAASPAQALIARHFGLPHHLWAEAFGIALIAIIIKSIKKSTLINTMAIIFLSVAGPLSNPMFFLILILCLFIPWLLYSAKTNTFRQTFFPIVIATIAIGIVGLFTQSQFSAGAPWKYVLESEKSWWTTEFILHPFIQSFSLFYPFVALLLILVPFGWVRWSPAMQKTFILTLCWSFLPVGMIYLSAFPWIPLVNGRIASDLSPIPIGLFATLSIYAASKVPVFRRSLTILVLLLFALGVGISFSLSVVYFNQTIQQQNKAVFNEGDSFTHYPTLDLWNGMMALKQAPAWSHIMVLPRIGDLLPAYIPIRVYQAQPHDGDKYWLAQRGWSHLFYTGEMSQDNLRGFFTDNNISYVFYGPEEKTATLTPTFYPDVLEVIFQNPEVTIFKVKKL